MDNEFFKKFSMQWIAAWNSHDVDKILSHYTDSFEMSSPIIVLLMNESSGRLLGKKVIRAYWEKALKLNPDLHFDFISYYQGANSLVIHYKGHRGLSAETFFFNRDGKVISAHAHYEGGELIK